MGRASRWLRGLLGGGKKPPPPDPGASPAEPRPPKEKKRWCFVKPFRDKERHFGHPPTTRGSTEASYYSEVCRPASALAGEAAALAMEEDEQSKRAIAVAAATAAVAEAAVAAAQAAAAVVRLTSGGRGASGFAGAAAKSEVVKREIGSAAVKIQAAFRGYLARRALKALRGLVKLQALVRGNIVRKQAAETLRCMQALVRVQARARACRVLQSEMSRSEKSYGSQADPPTPEKHEEEEDAQFIISKSERSSNSKRNSAKRSLYIADHARANSAEWNWWDLWMEERYGDSREATRKVGTSASMDDEKSAKILEIDPGKQQFNHRRRSNHYNSSCSTVTSEQNSRNLVTVPGSPSKDSMAAQQSVPSPSSVDMQQSLSSLMGTHEAEEYSESPHMYSATSRQGSSRKEGPYTPSKSEYSFSVFSGYSDHPNYMGNTESFRAKVRSQSAPKQRPELEKSSFAKKSSAHGYGQQSNAQRSNSLHTKFTSKAYPGSCRLDRLGMPITN